jgi:hypothetical protein
MSFLLHNKLPLYTKFHHHKSRTFGLQHFYCILVA